MDRQVLLSQIAALFQTAQTAGVGPFMSGAVAAPYVEAGLIQATADANPNNAQEVRIELTPGGLAEVGAFLQASQSAASVPTSTVPLAGGVPGGDDFPPVPAPPVETGTDTVVATETSLPPVPAATETIDTTVATVPVNTAPTQEVVASTEQVPGSSPDRPVGIDEDGDGTADDTIRTNVAIPSISRGGGAGRTPDFPFDTLGDPEINEAGYVTAAPSFHEPFPKDKDPAKFVKKIGSATSAANRSWKVPVVPAKTETVERYRPKRDENNQIVTTTGEDGKEKRVMEKFQKTVKVTEQKRYFIYREVGSADPDGAGVRVWRIDNGKIPE